MIKSNENMNPFPGLRPFEASEYRLFFGREGQSDALIARLQRSHFLAVVGTSGSGKSSLVRAGLLPALRGGMMAGAGSGWRICIMRPGSDPIGNLALALADKDVLLAAGAGLSAAEAEAVIEATLRRGALGLVDAVRQARLEPHEKLMVVVDQFEELFRFRAARAASSTGDDAAAFVKLLLEAAQQSELPIYVVPTMRSDFLGDCAQFQGLPEAINDGQYLIPRMTRDERRFAITGPVGVTRGKITEPLVNRLMNDVGDNPDQLPILQHALMRTWDYWKAHRRNGDPIGLEHYEAIGAMSAALSLHADEAFNELPDERSRFIAERLFKALTERGADNREIRHPTRLGTICEIADANLSEVAAVIEVFRAGGRSFLMPPAGVALEPETIVDISHESLIRNWKRLQQWVDQEAQSARIYHRLAAATAFRDESYLPAGLLEAALAWREKNNPNAAWAARYASDSDVTFDQVMTFIDASTAAQVAAEEERERQRNAELERERREREQAEMYAAGQTRAARRLRWMVAGMAVMFLLALATAAFAMKARSDAVRARNAESSARGQTEKSRSALQQALGELQKQQTALQQSVAEKQKANEALQLAEDKAQTEADRARELAKQADDARKDAEAKAIFANQQQILAKQEAEKNLKRKESNEKFREAALYVQRGKYQDAKNYFSEAIELYQNPLVNSQEAIADATVELGNLSLTVARNSYRGNDLRLNNIMGNLLTSIGKYDEAAKIYSSAAVNAPEKAAATKFSLAINLLPFAYDTVTRISSDRDEEVASAGWDGAEGELPDISIGPKVSVGSGPLPFLDYDPVQKLKETAVAHFRASLSDYRQVFEQDKNKTEAAREGIRKASYQLAEFYLNEATTTDDPNKGANVEELRRLAVQHYEELLSTFPPDDVAHGKVLIWLGGLNSRLSQGNANSAEGKKAAAYYDRALTAWQKAEADYSSKADILAKMADVLHDHNQLQESADFYHRAAQAYAGLGDQVKEAEMYVNRGQTYEKLSENSSTSTDAVARASACYVYAMTVYARVRDAAVGRTTPDKAFAVGSFYKRSGHESEALEAFDLTIKFAQPFKRDDIEIYQARAYTEKGSILASQNKPREALDAYKQALTIYDQLAAARAGVNGSKEQADAEGDRVRFIVKAIESSLTDDAAKKP